eukprot:707144-Amphidinium_carterae.1
MVVGPHVHGLTEKGPLPSVLTGTILQYLLLLNRTSQNAFNIFALNTLNSHLLTNCVTYIFRATSPLKPPKRQDRKYHLKPYTKLPSLVVLLLRAQHDLALL